MTGCVGSGHNGLHLFFIHCGGNGRLRRQSRLSWAQTYRSHANADPVRLPQWGNQLSYRSLRAHRLLKAARVPSALGVRAPPRESPKDIEALLAGFQFSGDQLFGELCEIDLPALGLDFPVPMFCFMGTEDQQTAFAPAEAWFTSINAPRKAFVRFEGCHHFVVMNRPEMSLEQLLDHVIPAISAPETP